MDNTKEYFKDISDRWTKRYDQAPQTIWDLDLLLRRENVHRMIDALLATQPQRPLQVLDIGCGTGDALDGYCRSQLQVRGFDLVPEMVAIAQKNHPEDHYDVQDIKNLPLKKNSRDIIICLGVLEYVDDPSLALKGMFEELKPGGTVIVSFPNNKCILRHLTRWLTMLEQTAATIIRKLQGRSRRTTPSQYEHTSWYPDRVKRMLHANGIHYDRVYYNTFAIGGRLGSLRPMIALSKWLTKRLYQHPLGEYFAMTTVFQGTRLKRH